MITAHPLTLAMAVKTSGEDSSGYHSLISCMLWCSGVMRDTRLTRLFEGTRVRPNQATIDSRCAWAARPCYAKDKDRTTGQQSSGTCTAAEVLVWYTDPLTDSGPDGSSPRGS